jgi:hypothetical protein
MSEQLGNFLTDLSRDPFKRENFRKNPVKALDAAGLEEQDRHLILSGDAAAIRSRFGVHLASPSMTEEKKVKQQDKVTAKKPKTKKK